MVKTIVKYCPFCGKKLRDYTPAVFDWWDKYCKKCQIGFRNPVSGSRIIYDKFEEKI